MKTSFWQDNVEDHLVQKGLWGLITGDTTTPELRTPDQIEPPPLPAGPSTDTEEQQLARLTAHQQAAEAALAYGFVFSLKLSFVMTRRNMMLKSRRQMGFLSFLLTHHSAPLSQRTLQRRSMMKS